MNNILKAGLILAATPFLNGCVLALGAAAGAVAVDELNENDGKFDPLEEAYDGDRRTKPIIDDDL